MSRFYLYIGDGMHTIGNIYATECVYWNKYKEEWSRDGCRVISISLLILLFYVLCELTNTLFVLYFNVQVGKRNKKSEASCKCSHLTTFASNTFVPPNTIDFKNVWKKFADLGNNLCVFLVVLLILALYFILVIVARYHDKLDVVKVSQGWYIPLFLIHM